MTFFPALPQLLSFHAAKEIFVMVVGRYPTAHCAPKYAASRGGVGEYGRRSGGGRGEGRFTPKFTLTLRRPTYKGLPYIVERKPFT